MWTIETKRVHWFPQVSAVRWFTPQSPTIVTARITEYRQQCFFRRAASR